MIQSWEIENQKFFTEVMQLLQREGLSAEAEDPHLEFLDLPVLFFCCTPKVADKIRSMPKVRSVVIDECQFDRDEA